MLAKWYYQAKIKRLHNCVQYHIRGLFGGEFNLAVWQIKIKLPNLKHTILQSNRLPYYFHTTRGMAFLKFFKRQEKTSDANSLLSRKEIESADQYVVKTLESTGERTV